MGAAPGPRRRLLEMVDPTSPVLAVELLLFGVWGILAPYAGRPVGLIVDAMPIVEVVDHVIPGAAVLAVAGLSLAAGHRFFAGSLLVLLAGIWMTATHVPLLVQAANGGASISAALFHSIPGLVIMVLGAIAVVADAAAAGGTGAAARGARGGGVDGGEEPRV